MVARVPYPMTDDPRVGAAAARSARRSPVRWPGTVVPRRTGVGHEDASTSLGGAAMAAPLKRGTSTVGVLLVERDPSAPEFRRRGRGDAGLAGRAGRHRRRQRAAAPGGPAAVGHRPADRRRQPAAHDDDAWPVRSSARPGSSGRSRCCCSTSTTSSGSTTRSATPSATRCCASWPGGCTKPCARSTRSPATAARSSSSSARRPTPRAPASLADRVCADRARRATSSSARTPCRSPSRSASRRSRSNGVASGDLVRVGRRGAVRREARRPGPVAQRERPAGQRADRRSLAIRAPPVARDRR